MKKLVLLLPMFLVGCQKEVIQQLPPQQSQNRIIIVPPSQPKPNINIEVSPRPPRSNGIHIDINRCR